MCDWGCSCGDGGGTGVFGLGDALFDLREGLLFALVEAFEFGCDTVLDLELDGFGAGGVGLIDL